MKTVGIRDLKARASEIVREVREQGEPYMVTVAGQKAAVLRPIADEDLEEDIEDLLDQELREIDRIGRMISEDWPPGVSAAEAVAEQRRKPMYGDP